MQRGPVGTDEIRRLREEGGYAIPAELVVDGMSVFSALLSDPVRPPSENSMAGHLWWLSDQLRTKQLKDIDIPVRPLLSQQCHEFRQIGRDLGPLAIDHELWLRV